jgi:hypothetical protein
MFHDIGFGRRFAVGLFLAVGAVRPGCGPAENLPECAPVSGKVTINGQPLSNAMITFHPEKGENRGQAASDAEGKYTLTTYASEDGAVVGKHTVTVERYILPMPSTPGGKLPTAKSEVPKKYFTPETSPLKVEVKSGQNNVIDLNLEK